MTPGSDPIPFPRYERATGYWSERAYFTNGAHVMWEVYGSPDPPAAVMAFYRDALGTDGMPNEHGAGVTWHLPPEDPLRTVTVSPLEADGLHRGSRRPSPEGTRTVIVVSHRFGGLDLGGQQ